jgi:AAA family ATP:ADP antiporter
MKLHELKLATRALRRGVDVRDDEVGVLLLSCAYFFFILASYYILRPIRDEVAVASGVRTLPWMYTGTLILSLLVHPPFAALVARLPRTVFISYTYRFFMSNLLIFFLLLKLAPESANIWVGRAFYWWVSVFNLFVVSVFWAFMADVFRSDQGKRLFGFIAVGGTLGAILGAGTTAVLAEVIGPVHLILISVLLIEIAVQCVRQLSKRVTLAPASVKSVSDKPQRTSDERIGGGILAGIAQVFRSPYLLGICGYMLLYTIVSTFLYSQQTWIIQETILDRAVRTAFFAKIDVAVNVLTLLTQIFLTGRLIKWLGVAVTLSILPAVCILGFTGLGLWPFLGVLVVFQTLRRAGNYGVARPTREILYTVVSREEKYKAKNFIDVFVYRGGDQVGVWAYGAMVWLGVSMSATAFAAVPICAAWLLVGYALGRRQETLARSQARSDAAVVAVPAVL